MLRRYSIYIYCYIGQIKICSFSFYKTRPRSFSSSTTLTIFDMVSKSPAPPRWSNQNFVCGKFSFASRSRFSIASFLILHVSHEPLAGTKSRSLIVVCFVLARRSNVSSVISVLGDIVCRDFVLFWWRVTWFTYGERNLCKTPVEHALATKAVETKMENIYCIVDSSVRKTLQLFSWRVKLTSNQLTYLQWTCIHLYPPLEL